MSSFACLCDKSSWRLHKARKKLPCNHKLNRRSQNNYFPFVVAAHVSFVISTYFFSYHHRLYFTLFLHWLQFPFCVYSSFAFCRKLLFYSQADHFLNFVNTHTQFHFLKFIFASSSFENSFFFCCSFCVCNGN